MRQPPKMVKHTQTGCSNTLKQIRRLLPKNCFSVFDHFVGLTLKALKTVPYIYEPYMGVPAAVAINPLW